MKLYIQPYNLNSESAAILASSLGAKRIKHENSNYKSMPDHVILNWGSKTEYPYGHVINHPEQVAIACNKLHTLNRLSERDISIPDFTENKGKARVWKETGRTVLARTLLNSSEGKGISVCRPDDPSDIPDAPLYTKYIRKKSEFRVHVFAGKVIDVAEKRKKLDWNGESVPEIRSYRFGWVFCREDLEVPICVKTQALLAIKALGLTFGAVDVIYNEKLDRAFVLEVNTAPGIEGTTVDNYVTAIKAYLQKLQNANPLSDLS